MKITKTIIPRGRKYMECRIRSNMFGIGLPEGNNWENKKMQYLKRLRFTFSRIYERQN